MKNLRNSIISMESISDIIDHQSLTSQLVSDTSDLISGATVPGPNVVIDHGDQSVQSGEVALVEQHRLPPSSPVATLARHDLVVENNDSVAHTVVTTNDGTITEVEGAGPVVMVRTIIDGLSHSPVQSSFPTPTTTAVQQSNHQRQNHHQHNVRELRSQDQHQLVATHQQLLQIANGHSGQRLHFHHQQRMHDSSPVDFVSSDLTLNALSVGTSPTSTAAQIIAVKQEDKLVILNNSGKANSSNGVQDICSNSRINQRVGNANTLGVRVGIGVIDDLSSDAVEVTLNQHHHQHVQQQQQQLLQHHYVANSNSRGSSGSGASNLGDGGNGQSQHAHHNNGHNLQHHLRHHPHQSLITQNQQNRHANHTANSSHSSLSHHEALSVIVEQHDDSQDSTSQLLSPEMGVVSVGVVGDNSLEPTTYQTLTSVNERMSPPGFSPTSSYATLTPLQPLPPISTMSDKFAYGGHINGGGIGSNVNGVSTGSNSNSSSGGVGSFTVMPHQNSLSALSLSSLSGVQSPYSTYDKLQSMGMSMSPPHNYATSPSHTLSSMVVSCELHPPSTSPCGALSPQSTYSHTTDLHSPPLSGCKSSDDLNSSSVINNVRLRSNHSDTQKQVICLSPPTVSIGSNTIVGDNVVVTGYESPYCSHQRDLMVNTTPSSSSTSGGRSSQLQLQQSPTLSPHSVSAGSVSLNSPGGCSVINQSVVSLPPINGTMATLSAASLTGTNSGLMEISPLQRDAVVVSLTPSPPPNDIVGTAATLLTIQQPTHSHRQQLPETRNTSEDLQQQLHHHSKQQHPHPVTSDCSLNVNLDSNNLANVIEPQNVISNNTNMCNIGSQQSESHHQQQLQLNHGQVTRSSSSGTGTQSSGSAGSHNNSNIHGGHINSGGDMEEINTKELAQRISAELKRYSIPQAIFAQRVLCRSQGTLSDLLRNPKPWSKLKSGRETFRRMFKWLQEPEFQRMSALRMAAAQIPQRSGGGGGNNNCTSVISSANNTASVGGVLSMSNNRNTAGNSNTSNVNTMVTASSTVCRRKDEPHIEHMPQPKKPRLVFTDLQRRTLQAIFKETKRPSKEMQVTIARQLGLEPTTVGNFFMNARRRSMDKWRDDDSKNLNGSGSSNLNHMSNNSNSNIDRHQQNRHHHHQNLQHQSAALSPSNQHSLDLDEDGDIDLDLGHDDFDLDGDHDNDPDANDML